MSLPDIFFVFDVESIGLHGEGFAVGYAIKHRSGEHLADGMFACPPEMALGNDSDRKWVRENVPDIHPVCIHPMEVRTSFWRVWMEWKAKGAVLVADCAWPVEARFLAQCLDDQSEERKWQGPYPLHDLASIMLAVGRDPLTENSRLPDELPAHNPVNDAMQSARLLLECLTGEIVDPVSIPTYQPA